MSVDNTNVGVALGSELGVMVAAAGKKGVRVAEGIGSVVGVAKEILAGAGVQALKKRIKKNNRGFPKAFIEDIIISTRLLKIWRKNENSPLPTSR